MLGRSMADRDRSMRNDLRGAPAAARLYRLRDRFLAVRGRMLLHRRSRGLGGRRKGRGRLRRRGWWRECCRLRRERRWRLRGRRWGRKLCRRRRWRVLNRRRWRRRKVRGCRRRRRGKLRGCRRWWRILRGRRGRRRRGKLYRRRRRRWIVGNWGRRRRRRRRGPHRSRRRRRRCRSRRLRRARRMRMKVSPQVEHRVVRRRHDIDCPGKLAGLDQVGRGTTGQPALHLRRQVARRVVHRKHVQKNLQTRSVLGRAEHLCLALMSEALQLIFLIEAHDRPSTPAGPRRNAGPFPPTPSFSNVFP